MDPLIITFDIFCCYSAYHDNCIPADRRQQVAETTTEKTHKEGDYNKCDIVTTDRIWKQSVDKEGRCLKNWEESWGFLTEYDAKGNKKEREELPENTTVFSDTVPNTNSGNYGNRVTSEVGITMQKLENQFFGGQRKRKLGNDLVCY
ncbi:hypothetical protein FSP39_021111 [Pinctada imbricata]|uniref:Uncharacterized protein n=1 Tax=Pinctada imbricata TaxID=66713 RepID=A0AA88XNC2_PINIB|nr:hypothetical protein FSP39_021111 [Pinctada imbricata]